MEESVEILEIAHLLQNKLAILPGGLDRDGYPLLIFYDIALDIASVDNGEFLKLIEYLSAIARTLWDVDYLTVVVDRRTAKWQTVKSLFLKLKGVNSFQIHKVLLLKPKGFFQKHFGNDKKEIQELFDSKIVFLENQDSLFNHIEVRQLPEDLGGVFEFNHLDWVEHRTAIERFEITCKKTQSRLEQVRLKFNRIEPLSSFQEIEEIRRLHTKVVDDVDDDLTCSKGVAETLETIVKKPFSNKEIKPLSQINFDYLQKWMNCLDDMRVELQSLWKTHEKYLEDSIELCKFEEEYGMVSKAMLELTVEVKDRKDIGMTRETATELMKGLYSFKDKTKETYEKIKRLREDGFQLIDKEHFSSTSIRLRCDEIKKLCDKFEDALEDRRVVLQTNIDVHSCLDQLDSWCKNGVDLLASQSLDEIQHSEGASKALEQIEKFIANGDGLSMGKINRLNSLSKKLDSKDIDQKVKEALKRTEEISEMFEKRENSLKKLSKPPARPVQPVKAIQKPLSPSNMRDRTNAQTSRGNSQTPTNSRAGRDLENAKKNIDVVVTSQPVKKRMSIRRSFSKRRPFSTPVLMANGRNKFETPARRSRRKMSNDGQSNKKCSVSSMPSFVGHIGFTGSPSSSMDYEEENKDLLKKTSLIMRELIDTERDYVNDIECVIKGYYNAFDDPNFNIPFHLRGKKNIIFGNIEGIYRFHRAVFLKELETCEKSPYLVGQVFLDKREEFQLYAIYCKNKPNSEALMKELEQKSTFLKDFQTKLGHKLPLDSYLLKPVQRITKYQLLLQEIMKNTSRQNPALFDLQNALKTMKKILRNVNDIMHSTGLTGFPEDISAQGKLLLQDNFIVWNIHNKMLRQITKLRGKNRQVFLYEKCLIFTKKEPRELDEGKDDYVYQFKSLLKMSDIGLTETVKDNPCKFEVWLQGRNEVHVLQPPAKEIKESWVAEIRKLLVDQLNSVKEKNQPNIKSKSSLQYIDPQRRGSAPNITALSFSAPPISKDVSAEVFTFAEKSPTFNTANNLNTPTMNQRRGSDMELWRASESSSSGVYLSPATTSDILDSDVASNWSDSEFEDDFDEDDCGFEAERDNISQKTTSSSVSETCSKRKFSALAEYKAMEGTELSLKLGDSLELVQTGEEGWWFMKNLSTEKEGWTPASYVEEQSHDSGIIVEDTKSEVMVRKSVSPRPRIETTV